MNRITGWCSLLMRHFLLKLDIHPLLFQTGSMNNLFTYGSLMFPEVWERLACPGYRSSLATLDGYLRRQVRGDTYPVIVPGDAMSRVEGMLYFDLPPELLLKLDRFEGEFYVRRKIRVTAGKERDLHEAFTYVLSDHYRHLLSDREWDPGRFRKQALALFLADYVGFGR